MIQKVHINTVQQRIQAACQRSHRHVSEVQVIAVTKYASVDTVAAAIQAGFTHIGENRWPDAEKKWNVFASEATWHFIGSLQTNKVKPIIERFSYVHSLDRISLAKEIEKQARERGKQVCCFVQVNMAGEVSKRGLHPADVQLFMEQLCLFPHIKPIGFMTLAPYTKDPEQTRPIFRSLRMLRDELESALSLSFPHLSMGMSNDFDIAIEEGATWIRLGSILMGEGGI